MVVILAKKKVERGNKISRIISVKHAVIFLFPEEKILSLLSVDKSMIKKYVYKIVAVSSKLYYSLQKLYYFFFCLFMEICLSIF